jgi:tRNA(Ile)-lysidine synthase
MRYWLREQGIRAPSTRKLEALEYDLLHAADDRQPGTHWDGVEVRRYRGLLYANPALPQESALQPLMWNWREPLELGQGLGRLTLCRSTAQGLDESQLPERLLVNFDHDGVRLHPQGSVHHRELKKLFQESGVLPWWRRYVPMIRNENALIAVGDLWIAAELSVSTASSARIVWEERPPIFAMREQTPR